MNRINRKTWTALCALGVAMTLAVSVNLAPALAGPRDNEPDMETITEFVGLYRNMLGLMTDFDTIASSPSASASMAVMGVEDHFQKDKAKAIKFLEKVRHDVDDKTVQRAICIKLADLYKDTGQTDKSVKQLESLILNQPGR